MLNQLPENPKPTALYHARMTLDAVSMCVERRWFQVRFSHKEGLADISAPLLRRFARHGRRIARDGLATRIRGREGGKDNTARGESTLWASLSRW